VLVEPAVLGDKFRAHVFIPNADINTGYVKRVGDVMVNYASITGIGDVGANTVSLNYSQQSSNTAYATSNTEISVDSFSTSQYRTAKYIIQAITDVEVHSTEVLLTHNDVDVFITEYATIYTGLDALINVTATLVSSNVYLKVTPLYANTVIDVSRNSLIARVFTAFNFDGDLESLSGTEDLQSGSGSVDLL
jgi:hypothetical protein